MRILRLALLSLSLLLSNNLLAQNGVCNSGGCASGGTNYPTGTFSTTSSTFQQVASDIYAGEYAEYQVTSGSTYEWSLCSADGGNASYDSQLTLFNGSWATLCYADDVCGDDAKISWTANYSGIARVKVSAFSCVTNSTNTTLVWRMSGGGGGGTCGGSGLSLPVPTLNSPNGNTYSSDQSITLSIYNNSALATDYRVQVAPSGTYWVSSVCAWECSNQAISGGINDYAQNAFNGTGWFYYTIPACALAPGTYSWTARVGNTGNQSCYATTRSFTVTASPTVPTNVTVQSTGSTELTVSWSPSTGAYGYRVYLCGSTSQLVYTTNTSVVIGGLTPNTAYNFRVRAEGNCGLSSYSGCSGNVYTRPAPPADPSNPGASCGSVTLTRGNPPSGVTWYWQGTNSSGTSTADNNLNYIAYSTNTYYYIRARGDVSGLWSTGSGQAYVTINQSPTQVGGLASTGQTSSSINLQWNQAQYANSYQIINCGTGQVVGTVNHPTTSFNVTGLPSNTAYQFKIRAVGTCNPNTETGCLSVSTLCSPPTINSVGHPQNSTVSLPTTSTTFSVTAAGSPTLTYQWQRNTGSGFTNIAGATSSTLSVAGITTVMNGYQYRCIVSGACSPCRNFQCRNTNG
jgi:hypothetical protein